MGNNSGIEQWQSDLIYEAIALTGIKEMKNPWRGFRSIRAEQLAGAVETLRGYSETDRELLVHCIRHMFTTKAHLFINLERLRQGDVLRYAVEAIPVASLFLTGISFNLQSQFILALLADDCAMTDGVPALPLDTIRGRVVEAFAGADITRASFEHLRWLGENAERLSAYRAVLEAHQNASREFCDQLLGLEIPALADGLL